MSAAVSISPAISRYSSSQKTEDIYSQYFSSPEKTERLIIVLHDYFDYHKRYRSLARNIARKGLGDVCLFDYRGFGMSGGSRGRIDSVEEMTRDLETVIREVRKIKPVNKITLLGIGIGGLISVDFLLNRKKEFCDCEFSQILVNPFLKLLQDTSQMMETFLGEMFHLKQFLPAYDVFDNNSNLKEAEKLFADPLAIKEINPSSFRSVKNKADEIKRNLYFLEDRTLFLVGVKGKISDNYMVKLFNKAMPVGYSEIKEYPQSGHDLLHDVEKDHVAKDILVWLENLS